MKGIKDIINKNKNFKFVVITHNREEYEALKEVLVELGYQHSIPLDELSVMMDERVREDGYDCCWRISDYMGVCWSEHSNISEDITFWKSITNDILELKNGHFEFV